MSIQVLIVEDNEDDFKIAERLLHEWRSDVEITWHKRIGDAIWELESHPRGTFERVYLDPGLPDVVGAVDRAFDVLVDTKKVRAEDVIIVTGGRWDSEIIAKVAKRGAQYITKEEAFSPNNLLSQMMLGMHADRELARLQADVNTQITGFKQQLHRDLRQFLVDVATLKTIVGEHGKKIDKLLDKTDGPQILAIRELLMEVKTQNQRDRHEIEALILRIGDEKSGLVGRIIQIELVASSASELTRLFDNRLKVVEAGLKSKESGEAIELEKVKARGQVRAALITAIVAIFTAMVPIALLVVPKMLDDDKKTAPTEAVSPSLSAPYQSQP